MAEGEKKKTDRKTKFIVYTPFYTERWEINIWTFESRITITARASRARSCARRQACRLELELELAVLLLLKRK